MESVHARYILIRDRTKGKDALADRLIEAVDNASLLPEDKALFVRYQKVRGIYLSEVKKSYVESCLLASRDLPAISDILDIPVETLDLYSRIFFDLTDFDKLSLLELVDRCEIPSEKGMKLWALSQGLDFIAWRLGKALNINPVDGLQELFTLAIFKSKEALFSGNTADSSKEATKWTKLSMDLAKMLKVWVMDSNAAKKDIELALSEVIPDFKGFDSLD